jgi:adenylyltransferase/sulfurtransferase
MSFSETDLERYARHIVLREVGGTGQAKIRAAKVLVVGAGGLGSPIILYLAAAGVGTIGIADFDAVSLSNLQRQIAHRTADIGRLKTDSARDSALALNPHVTVATHAVKLTPENAGAIVAGYDIVADGSDNFDTRHLIADTCHFEAKTLVSAAVTEFAGQLATFKPEGRPCYRCFLPEAPPAGSVRPCTEAGVLGAAAGVMGTLAALEILKEVTGAGKTLAGRMLIYDALDTQFRTVTLKPDPQCPLCGKNPRISRL